MSKQKVTAVFDIGKTNKKFFLFDEAYNQVFKSYCSIPEIEDEDGFPTENLTALEAWIQTSFEHTIKSSEYEISSINFSSYGASLVHLDEHGKPLTPLYNYLKPVPEDILEEFYSAHGSRESLERSTGSPITGDLLNSGLQLYWLKKANRQLFSKIKWSLHLPQYLSYKFSGEVCSEYTSIGCHTLLWDYRKDDYHDWVYYESIDKILPPNVDAKHTLQRKIHGQPIQVGTGIHDSSSALLPYLLTDSKPFLLLSTGTWSIALNAFANKVSHDEGSAGEDLFYMRIDGKPVKASRYFLGDTYNKLVNQLSEHFGKSKTFHKQIKFDAALFLRLKQQELSHIIVEHNMDVITASTLDSFSSFEEAYHQLMIELVSLQTEAIKRAIGSTVIERMYIDGGFVDNDIFIKLIAIQFPELKVCTTQSPLGSALGAAMVLDQQQLPENFLTKHYKMKVLEPFELVNP